MERPNGPFILALVIVLTFVILYSRKLFLEWKEQERLKKGKEWLGVLEENYRDKIITIRVREDLGPYNEKRFQVHYSSPNVCGFYNSGIDGKRIKENILENLPQMYRNIDKILDTKDDTQLVKKTLEEIKANSSDYIHLTETVVDLMRREDDMKKFLSNSSEETNGLDWGNNKTNQHG